MLPETTKQSVSANPLEWPYGNKPICNIVQKARNHRSADTRFSAQPQQIVRHSLTHGLVHALNSIKKSNKFV